MPASHLPLPGTLSLVGRRILVTGAASGIGRATAAVVAQLGGDLLLTDLAPLADVAADLRTGGATVTTVQADLRDPDAVGQLLEGADLHGGVHCAGVLPASPLHEDPAAVERCHRTMDINVRVPIDLGWALVGHLAHRGGGAVVLLGSVAGRTGGSSPRTPVDYSAGKGAVHTVVRWLARNAVGQGVRVNGIAPGPVRSPMTAASTLDPARLPLGRLGEPEEVAWVAAFLLTPAAAYVAGAVLDVNGASFVG